MRRATRSLSASAVVNVTRFSSADFFDAVNDVLSMARTNSEGGAAVGWPDEEEDGHAPDPTLPRSPRAVSRAVARGDVICGPCAHVEGFLTKQGGVFPTWRRRYVRLEGQILSYALGPHSAQPIRAVRLGPGSVVHDVEGDPLGFRCAPAGDAERVFFFRAATLEIRAKWVAAIRAASRKPSHGSHGTSPQASTTSGGWTAGTPSSQTPAGARRSSGVDLDA